MFKSGSLLKRLIDRRERQGQRPPDAAGEAPHIASETPEALPDTAPVVAPIEDMAATAREKFPAAPIEDIPFPTVDCAAASCIDAILASPEFAAAGQYFAVSFSARRSLVSASSQALIYALLRNMRPQHVVEIGTYRASTTEAMCRALQANGQGLVHTIEPYVADWLPHILAQWPQELRDRARVYPMNSAAFFPQCHFHPDLVFIDGHHDFEYALFDMQATARIINAGGLVIIDNISQPGPFLAAQQFCRDNPGWTEIGNSLGNFRPGHPFDTQRATIAGTDACVLRAPHLLRLDSRPTGLPTVYLNALAEIAIAPAGEPQGALLVQCILRTFSDPPHEQTFERSSWINGGGLHVVAFDPPLRPVVEGALFTVELWLSWTGAEQLILESPPVLR